MSETMLTRTYEDLLADYPEGLLSEIDNYWAALSFEDIVRAMPDPIEVPIDTERNIKLIEIAPLGVDTHDISHDIVFSLPYLNAYTPKSFMKTRTLQLANPNYSVWLIPDNTFRGKASIFNTEERFRLAHGDMRPLGEIQMRAFENIDHGIQKLAATGRAQGALAALALAGIKGGIEVDRVNADEITLGHSNPKKQKPGKTLTGSPAELVESALNNDASVKLGFIASKQHLDIKDLESHLLESPQLSIVQYQGDRFEQMETMDARMKIHALMANDGLQLS